jgi:hypothetical protein
VRLTALAKIVVGVEVEAARRGAHGSISSAIGFGGGWDAIRGILDADRSDATTLYAGEAAIELHRTETANCRQNLCSGMPALSFCDR